MIHMETSVNHLRPEHNLATSNHSLHFFCTVYLLFLVHMGHYLYLHGLEWFKLASLAWLALSLSCMGQQHIQGGCGMQGPPS